jgi:hypothetical protein
MRRISKAAVFATLLVVWCFPMVSSAKAMSSEASQPGAMVQRAPRDGTAATSSSAGEASSLATREQQARSLQDFKGGGVSIYIGSGVLFIALIILLILLI